jgi:spoIIIJ-associated protein
MAPKYEFEGKTTEEAQAKACEELGLSEDQMETEVISYGSTGIFGLVGVKKAKIRVAVPESSAPSPAPPEPAGESEPKVAAAAKEVLETILSYIAEGTTVTARANPEEITLEVNGDNAALLIGKHGKTLDALQYIVQRIVQKQEDTRIRVTVDVEGYRNRRKDSLSRLAVRLGNKVKQSGKPATIKPMNAYDRRIVHLTLKKDPKLRTQSKGSGSFRKVVIYPYKKPGQSQDADSHK